MLDDEFALWIESLKRRDDQAVDDLWRDYFEKLVRLARRRLSRLPRRDCDEEDVALSAINSFVRGVEADRFPVLSDRHDLWRVLLTIAVRKSIRQERRHRAAKRGAGRVRGESIFVRGDGSDATPGLAAVLGSEPNPALAAETAETCSELLTTLDDELLRTIALEKLEGYTNGQIAERHDCTRRTIERKLDLIRRKWDKHLTT